MAIGHETFLRALSVGKYFADNGVLSLFLVDNKSLLLENVVALSLRRRYGGELFYFKPSKTGIDVDFFLNNAGGAMSAKRSEEGKPGRRSGSPWVPDGTDWRLVAVFRGYPEYHLV